MGIVDRGIPTEDTASEMRASDPPVSYLVGAPRARWEQFQAEFEERPWQKLRDTVEVKLPADGRELLLPRYTQPEPEHRLVLEKLGWALPPRAPPHIRPPNVAAPDKRGDLRLAALTVFGNRSNCTRSHNAILGFQFGLDCIEAAKSIRNTIFSWQLRMTQET